jgi:hypothetical protein
MNQDPPKPVDDAEPARPDESFFQRFHRRKQEARLTEGKSPASAAQDHQLPPLDAQQAAPAPELTDADMPPIESLTVDSDYSGFLSAKVSESLRRAALRKLFHSGELNVIDGLDDYAEDFTTFAALGDFVTADMRHRIAIEAKKKAEAVKQALLEDQETPGEIESAQADAHPGGQTETGIGDGELPTPKSEST